MIASVKGMESYSNHGTVVDASVNTIGTRSLRGKQTNEQTQQAIASILGKHSNWITDNSYIGKRVTHRVDVLDSSTLPRLGSLARLVSYQKSGLVELTGLTNKLPSLFF